jgi:hypothetical protein
MNDEQPKPADEQPKKKARNPRRFQGGFSR